MVERVNRKLNDSFRKVLSTYHTEWDNYLDYLEFVLNTLHSTPTECSAFFVLYGQPALNWFDLNLPFTSHLQGNSRLFMQDFIRNITNSRKLVALNI